MIVQWNVSTGDYIATLPGYPGDRPWGSAWRNPGALVANCPAEYQGSGYGPATVTTTLGSHEEWAGEPNYSAGSLVDGEWECTRPKQTTALSSHKASKASEIKVKAAAIVADGFVYDLPGNDPADPHTYQIDESAQANMTSIAGMFALGESNAHGGFWRALDNANVTMTDAQVKAFFIAAAAYKTAVIRRMWELIAAVSDATDHAGLDLINIETGAIDGSGAWPAN